MEGANGTAAAAAAVGESFGLASKDDLERLAAQVAVLVERVGEVEDDAAARKMLVTAHGRRLAETEDALDGHQLSLKIAKDAGLKTCEILEEHDNRLTALEHLAQGVAFVEGRGLVTQEQLAEYEQSKASIAEGSESDLMPVAQSPMPSPINPPVAGAGPSGPAPAVSLGGGSDIVADELHDWLMRHAVAHAERGLAAEDCRRVAALEHLAGETGQVGEVVARLLAVGMQLEMWAEDMPAHAYLARVRGLGLDALGYEKFDLLGVESRLRERWRSFRAGEFVPEVGRLRMDDCLERCAADADAGRTGGAA